LSITVDPDRDTPARLAAYQQLFAPAPANWTLLTGTPDAVAALWRYLGVFIQKVPDTGPAPKDWLTGKPLTYDITHSDELFFVDANRSERFLFTGSPHVAPGTQLPQALLHFLDETGMNNLNRPGADAWTVTDELEVLSWLLGRRIPSAVTGSPAR
jgi:cytochrome oxidase Cu insertion factor (SCO1/SenC/PrrC family)